MHDYRACTGTPGRQGLRCHWILLGALAQACSGSRVAPHDSTTTAATVYEKNLAPASLVWSTSPVFSTDGLDSVQIGSGGALFARLLDSDDLLIGNGGHVVVVDRAGRFVRTFAREGDGPGEFRRILHLGIGEDSSVFVSDFLSGRLTTMAASGEVQRTITRIAPFGDVDVEPISLFANGDVLGVPFQWRPARDQPLGVAVGNLNRDRVVLLMYSPEGAVVDSIGAWLGIQRFRGMVVPFARSVVYSSRQTTTAIGPTDSLDVSIYDRDTRLVRLLGSANNRPISSQDREHWRSAVLAADSNSGRQIVAATKEMPVPSELPDIGWPCRRRRRQRVGRRLCCPADHNATMAVFFEPRTGLGNR